YHSIFLRRTFLRSISTPIPYTTLFRPPPAAATVRRRLRRARRSTRCRARQGGCRSTHPSARAQRAARQLLPACARPPRPAGRWWDFQTSRSEEHTSELQSREKLVCRLLLEKKKGMRVLKGGWLICLLCFVPSAALLLP